MTDITIDVSGPGAERAAVFARSAEGSARDAAGSAALAGSSLQAIAAVALTSGIYPTVAAGLAATADGGMFWALRAGKPIYFQRVAAAATVIYSLSGSDGFALSAFGAVEDARTVVPASMTAGSGVLTAGAGATPFTASDVGKAIRVAGAGAGGAKLVTTITAVGSATQATLAVAALTTTSGKAASIGTDCASALQAAYAAVKAAGGGTISVDGYYLLGSPTTLSGANADVRLASTGSDSGFLIAGAPTDDMITITGVPKLSIDGVNFVGTPGEYDDARRVLFLDHCEANIRNCGFYGLSNMNVSSAAIVWADTCDLAMEDNDFGGCAMGSGIYNCVINNENWAGFSSTRDRFLDYGTFRGVYHSKTPIAFCYAWIRVADQFVQKSNAVGQSVVRITDSRFDEGHFRAIVIEPGVAAGGRISRVHLDGVQVNNTILDGGSSFFVVRADHVKIEQCAIGWAASPHDGISLIQCGEVMVDSVHVTDGAPFTPTGMADGIYADTVDSLTIINSPTIRRFNFTGVKKVRRIENGMGGVEPLAKLGPVDDDDFASPPPIGTIAIDTLNKRTYVKTISGWVAGPVMTAGDPRLALRNVTPSTSLVKPTDTMTKVSGGTSWANSTANLNPTLTGSFRMLITFPSTQDGARVRAGAQDSSKGVSYVTGVADILCGVLCEGGYQIYTCGGSDLLSGPFPYTPGQLVELVYDSAAATMTLLINGAQVDKRDKPITITSSTVHRFAATLHTVGTSVQILKYAAP